MGSSCPLSPWPLLPPYLRARRQLLLLKLRLLLLLRRMLLQPFPTSTMLPVMLPNRMYTRRCPLRRLRSLPKLTCTRKSLSKCMNTMPPVTLPRRTHMKTLLRKCTHTRSPWFLQWPQDILCLPHGRSDPYHCVRRSVPGHPLTYPYAAYHTPTGCVNNVGSVVPCA